MNSIVSLLAVLLVTISCTGVGGSLQTPATDGESEQATRLRFATRTPDPQAQYDDVKAELEEAGLSAFAGKSKDAAFYGLIAECGGPIGIRDGLVNGAMPDEQLVESSDGSTWYAEREGVLVPLQMQLYQGWKYNIEWTVLEFAARGGVWKAAAEGYITDSCEVHVD